MSTGRLTGSQSSTSTSAPWASGAIESTSVGGPDRASMLPTPDTMSSGSS